MMIIVGFLLPSLLVLTQHFTYYINVVGTQKEWLEIDVTYNQNYNPDVEKQIGRTVRKTPKAKGKIHS